LLPLWPAAASRGDESGHCSSHGLATGGTIAGVRAPEGGYGYKSGALDIKDLISAVPNLDKLAIIEGEQVVNIGSQDTNNEAWPRCPVPTSSMPMPA